MRFSQQPPEKASTYAIIGETWRSSARKPFRDPRAAVPRRRGNPAIPAGIPFHSTAAAELTPESGRVFAADVPIPVHGVAARREALVISVSAAGQAEAWQKATVVAQVGGQVAALPVRESLRVGQGQTLPALDPAEYGLAVEEARAGLRDAQAKFQEMTLFDDRIADAATRAGRAAIARSKSGMEAAEVRLRRAQLDLVRTRLASPFAGRVVPGQAV